MCDGLPDVRVIPSYPQFYRTYAQKVKVLGFGPGFAAKRSICSGLAICQRMKIHLECSIKLFDQLRIFRIFLFGKVLILMKISAEWCPFSGAMVPIYGALGIRLRFRRCPQSGPGEPVFGAGFGPDYVKMPSDS